MTEPIRITVTAEDAGRADKAVARHFPTAGRKQLAELFEAGAVRVRGKRAKKGERVAPGDVIELAHAPEAGPRLANAATGLTQPNPALRPIADPALALDVVIERPDLVVVAKPAGIPSQPLRAGERGTVANAIAARWPECARLDADPACPPGYDPRDGGLVHRLDIGTSGALIAARDAATYRELRAAFSEGRVHKEYLAITNARPVSRECDAPLAQRGDHVRVDHTDGLPAHTAFAVEHATASHALVRCVATTGRMHQVRAHLAYVGAPLAGDTRYGGTPVAGHDGFFLHAAVLRLSLHGEPLAIELPPPAPFAAVLAALGLGD
jgi:23S rRNA pseudouridine1911/1915/1917 synthase